MLDTNATLNTMIDRMEALNGKTLKPIDWTQELAEQVIMLIMVCKQQQIEIDRLKSRTGVIG